MLGQVGVVGMLVGWCLLAFALLMIVRESRASWLQDREVRPGYPADRWWRDGR